MVELELKYEGYEVGKAADGRTGLEMALTGDYDLILLDIMLPALNGMEVLRRLRREKLVPVIMQMIEQADGQGRIVMAQLLGAFGDESVLPVLDKLAASEDYTLRKVAVEAMAEIGTSAILPAMARALDDGSWQLRLVAVEAIGRHELTDGVPLLQSALLKENAVGFDLSGGKCVFNRL